MMHPKFAIPSLVLLATSSSLPALADDDGLENARAMVIAAMPDDCDADMADRFPGSEGTAYDVAWQESDYQGGTETKTGKLYNIVCVIGAYNTSNAFVFAPDGGTSPQILYFAEPSYDVEYEAGDDSDTKLAHDPVVKGFGTANQLTNGEFDPETNTISSFAKWRGLGDAWSQGDWKLVDGAFILTHYAVDPIYEYNLENPPEALADVNFVLYDASAN